MNPWQITATTLSPRRMAQRTAGAMALLRSGMLTPPRPDRIVGIVKAAKRWGATAAGMVAANAARHPDSAAVIDDHGRQTWRELHARTNAIAHALRDDGLRPGDRVAILTRNHGGLLEATVAASKVGADVLYLNTGFAAPQLQAVLEREGAGTIVYDDEFASVVTAGGGDRRQIVAWVDTGHRPSVPTLDDLAAGRPPTDPPAPGRSSRVVILTSGTTGTPKGANRPASGSMDAALALFERIPFRARGATVIAAPLFHAWGLSNSTIAMALGSTSVLQRKFDPEATLRAVVEHRATALIVVPVMLQRMLALPDSAVRGLDLSSLQIVGSSGSALPGDLATAWMDRFGDNLYNLYGSTEVAWASVATPADLRAAPGTAGRVPLGTTVRIYDTGGRAVPAGTTGRIFVGNDLQFEGYTGGGGKERTDGLMSIGDLGHFDAAGRLFVEGREDDMIVSGGENVFPSEVEDLLSRHPAVADVAVVGVPDAEFGQGLRAVVVKRPGATLNEAQVKEHVRENLARYKVPREVVFVTALPRNATGKILRRELRDVRAG